MDYHPRSMGSLLPPEVDPNALLQRAPELDLRLQSDGSVRIDREGRSDRFGPHSLRVLDAFARPTSFRAALDVLKSQIEGVQDWVDLSNTIRGLYRAGVLDTVEGASRRPSVPTGFATPSEHISMLNDRARTGSYLEAIAEVVRPGDVVVEIGTGTGVLAVAAARAGARHVYAIEAAQIGTTARALFQANGLGDRITLVPGWSTQVSLPERADVLISEIIGDEPLHERVLQATADAIKRFLRPAARLVPRSLRIYALPVSLPDDVIARFRFTESARAEWGEWYGIDFGPLGATGTTSAQRIFAQPTRAREWVPLAEPVQLADIDFTSGRPPEVESDARVVASGAGPVHAVVEYFELELSPSVTLSLAPERAIERSSWHLPVWLLQEPIDVAAGELLSLAYRYGTGPRHGQVTISRADLA